jgi:hypothetical protein
MVELLLFKEFMVVRFGDSTILLKSLNNISALLQVTPLCIISEIS